MAAITWRTLMGASPSEASRGFESAQRSIAGAFDQLGGLIKDREAGIKAEEDRAAEGRVQGFLDRIQGVRTPEGVAALQASGELDALRASLRPADLARVRGAEEARTTALRQGVVAENAFNDQVLARTRAPLINEAKMFVANNDRAGLQAFLAKHDLGDEATFLTQLTAAEQAKTEFGWKEGNQKHTEALRPLDLQARKMGITASQEQINASRESRDLAADQREQLKAATRVAAKEAELRENGNPFAIDGVFGPGRVEELNKTLVDGGIGDDSDARAENIKRVMEQTAGKNVPMSLVKEAVLGSSGGFFWNSDDDWGDTAEENLRKALERTREVEDGKGNLRTGNAAGADYLEWQLNRRAALANPLPATPKKR
jgi:hypothetical protein